MLMVNTKGRNSNEQSKEDKVYTTNDSKNDLVCRFCRPCECRYLPFLSGTNLAPGRNVILSSVSVSLWVCLRVALCLLVCVCVCVSLSLCLCLCLCVSECFCVWLCACLWVAVCVSGSMFVYEIFLCVCVSLEDSLSRCVSVWVWLGGWVCLWIWAFFFVCGTWFGLVQSSYPTASSLLRSSFLISCCCFCSSFLEFIKRSKSRACTRNFLLFFQLHTFVCNSERAVFLHQITSVAPLDGTRGTFLLQYHLLTCVIQWGTEEGKWNNFMLESDHDDTQYNEMDDLFSCRHRSIRAQKKSLLSPLHEWLVTVVGTEMISDIWYPIFYRKWFSIDFNWFRWVPTSFCLQ